MSNASIPRNVFIDTVVFVRGNFDYSATIFREVVSLESRGLIQVVTTDITVREIKAQTEEAIERALPRLPTKGILRNSDLPEIKRRRDPVAQDAFEKELTKELLNQFEQFMRDANVRIIEFESEGILEVFDDYFERNPPFGIGKNKAEFPDACALNALEKWCDVEDDDLAVITQDDGIITACRTTDRFQHFKDLDEYLKAVRSDDQTNSDD